MNLYPVRRRSSEQKEIELGDMLVDNVRLDITEHKLIEELEYLQRELNKGSIQQSYYESEALKINDTLSSYAEKRQNQVNSINELVDPNYRKSKIGKVVALLLRKR